MIWTSLRSILLMIALASILQAQPKIELAKSDIDFGKMYQGEVRKSSFKVYNRGTAPLLIKNLTAPCDCSTLSITSTTILPGKFALFTAKFDSKKIDGPFSKSIVIVSNDPKNWNGFVMLHGSVKPVLSFWPEAIILRHEEGRQDTTSLTITNGWKKPITLRSISDSMEYVQTFADWKKIAPGASRKLKAVLRARPPADTTGQLKLGFDCPLLKTTVINYFARKGS